MNYVIQEIRPEHDSAICEIIKSVGAEYGAIGEGFGPSDLEVSSMSQHYNDTSSSRYLVALIAGNVIGGCGIAPFNGSQNVCELRKLFLLPEGRGLGLGRRLTEDCLKYAKGIGYKECYLDTLRSMKSAISLYEKLGFRHLDKPFEGSPHTGCDVWMLMDLRGYIS